MRLCAFLTTLALACVAAIPGLEATSPVSSVHQSLSKRMNGGTQLNLRGFDYIVLIKPAYAAAGISACTGVLISSKYVLTMQSCLGDGNIIMNKDYSMINVTVAKSLSNTARSTVDYKVANAFTSTNFAPVGYFNHMAILQLQNDVPANFARPIKIYAGDFKQDTKIKLAGFATSANYTQYSDVSMTQLRYEYLTLESPDSCLNSSSEINPEIELCAPVTSGLNVCNADYGAPLLIYVNNRDSKPVDNGNDSVIVEANASNNDEFAGYALLGLTNFGYTTSPSNYVNCLNGGSQGIFTWIYPFIDQIANTTGLHVEKFTVVNKTPSNSQEPYLHPNVSFPIQSEAQASHDSRASRQDITPVYIIVAMSAAMFFIEII